MSERYQGTCPICGVTLVVAEGNKLRCLDNHYICDRWEFEKVWSHFQGKSRNTKLINLDVEGLFSDLFEEMRELRDKILEEPA